MPPVEFGLYMAGGGEDSGIESDTSPVSSTKLASSYEDIEDEVIVNPRSFLLGNKAPEKERIDGITNALNWLRDELTKMKETDKQLTRTFITMRSKIAEHKIKMESSSPITDHGYYDTDSIDNQSQGKNKKLDQWNLICKDGAFPTNGLDFENNKRATWII